MVYGGGLDFGIMILELDIKKLKKLDKLRMSLKEIIEEEEKTLAIMVGLKKYE